MQLQVFTGCGDAKPVIRAVGSSRIEGAVYHDVNDPRGVGMLGISEDPTFFASAFRDLLNTEPFAALSLRPQFTMLGRTFTSGFEDVIVVWLFRVARRKA